MLVWFLFLKLHFSWFYNGLERFQKQFFQVSSKCITTSTETKQKRGTERNKSKTRIKEFLKQRSVKFDGMWELIKKAMFTLYLICCIKPNGVTSILTQMKWEIITPPHRERKRHLRSPARKRCIIVFFFNQEIFFDTT